MPHDLSQHVALVTGSTTGLGKATALALGRCGARVALNYSNNRERAEAALAEIRAEGVEAELFRASVVEEEAVLGLFRDIADRLGEVDILVINATPAQPQMPIEEYTWPHYQAMIDFFIKSPYLLTRAALPAMKARKWGRIVHVGSEVFNRAVPEFSAYVSAKGAQTGFNRSMANELAPSGITMNLVAPGWIPVERHRDDPQEQKDAYLAEIPMGRWGVPEDVAHAITFFASEEASFITGQYLCVNGGMSMM